MAKGNQYLTDLLNDPIWDRTNIAEMAARQYLTECMEKIMEIVRDPNAPQALQLRAATEMMNRGFGKPAVAIRITNDKEKDIAAQTIEGEIFRAEEASRQIMELARQGGNSAFWLETKLIQN